MFTRVLPKEAAGIIYRPPIAWAIYVRASGDGRCRFTLVAGSLALTSSLPWASMTQIVTDLYDLKEWTCSRCSAS